MNPADQIRFDEPQAGLTRLAARFGRMPARNSASLA